MTRDSDVGHVWEMIEKIGFCMLASRDGEDIRSRPMSGHVDRDEHAIYFLTGVETHKDDEIEADPNVCLAYADTNGNNYVSISGHAEVSNDRAKIRELWSPWAKAWWDSPEDPSIRVLKVTPKDAQYWDGPGTVVSYVKMLAAAMSDGRPSMGEHGKVRM